MKNISEKTLVKIAAIRDRAQAVVDDGQNVQLDGMPKNDLQRKIDRARGIAEAAAAVLAGNRPFAAHKARIWIWGGCEKSNVITTILNAQI